MIYKYEEKGLMSHPFGPLFQKTFSVLIFLSKYQSKAYKYLLYNDSEFKFFIYFLIFTKNYILLTARFPFYIMVTSGHLSTVFRVLPTGLTTTALTALTLVGTPFRSLPLFLSELSSLSFFMEINELDEEFKRQN